MNALGMYYFQKGIDFFEKYEYEDAVEYFIHAYKLNVCRDEIIEILYSCFITPNEEEFQKTYLENAEGITTFPYEETVIDFIPVAEGHYYLFNRVEKKFYGRFDVPSATKRESIFHSLLISDAWDIREFTQKLIENEYATLYYVVNEQKSKFYSFFKVPEFAEIYLKNAICFESTEIMETFFREHSDVYLPKAVMGKNIECYKSLMADISDCRKKDCKTERKNIFLTIGIPSYNRGHILVKNVNHMLQMMYDSEIEIVVSDNGSTENVEGYQEIREMQDSRVKYVRLEENQGYAVNVLNVLKHSTGHFVMLASDEDILVLEQMGALLNVLYQNAEKGVIRTTGIGKNLLTLENEIIEAGINAVLESTKMNYLTGIIYNREFLNKYDILDMCYKLKDNLYVWYYTHIAIGMLISQYADLCCSSLLVWVEGEVCEEEDSFEKEEKILKYMTLESRIEQFEAATELVERMYGKSKVYELFFLTYLEKTYKLLLVLKTVRKTAFEKIYVWIDVCIYLYKYAISKAEKEQLQEIVKEEIQTIYLDYMKK